MSSLTNKRILLGVTGGIAAYKSADLVRRLQDLGAEVRVVMTRAAQEFITPMTMQALSGKPVHTELLDSEAEAAMGHIELARWADIVLVAPATANFIAKLVAGEGSDLLLTLCLATKAQVALAPAMNQGMWSNPAVQANITQLQQRSISIFGPAAGSQACGDVGVGRMLEAVDIAQQTANVFATGLLAGKTLVITAGPTREAIDPVRYISNHSSGKMGYALAQAAVEAGARVILVSGPVAIPPPDRVELVHVQSAADMLHAVEDCIASADIFIATAAVADYRPLEVQVHKIKKQDKQDSMTLELVKNPDILATIAASHPNIYKVGFAAETQDLVEYAKQKLERKNIDMVVANNVADAQIGFNSDENAVSVVRRGESSVTHFDKRSKAQLARDIIRLIGDVASAKAKPHN